MCKQRKKVIFALKPINRIGELVGEIFMLRNIFDDEEYDFVILTHCPDDDLKVNKVCYDFVMRGLTVCHPPSDKVYNWPTDKGIQETDGNIYVYLGIPELHCSFIQKVKGRKPSFYYSLTDKDIERGNRLRDIFEIPRDAPIVTLHNRESGYLSQLTYHSYRNANIENYIPAIEYLVGRGYYVVRLGDKSMKALPCISDRVIDMPFHRYYSPHVELHFIPSSKFMISVPSGPSQFSFAFDVPVLWINAPIQSIIQGNENDLFVPKKYYSHILKRYLTYGEIVTSPLADFYRAKKYEKFGVELHENSPEEILQATREMDARLEGKYDSDENINAVNERVKKVELKGHCFQQHACPEHPFLAMYWSKMQISNEYIKMNRYFLEERQWD